MIEQTIKDIVQSLQATLGNDWAVARGYQAEPATQKQCTITLENIGVSEEVQERGGDILIYQLAVILQAPRNVLDEERLYTYLPAVIQAMEEKNWTFTTSEFSTAMENNSELLSVLDVSFTTSGAYGELE